MTFQDDAILVVNAGSSSIKFALFVAEEGELNCCLRGEIERIGRSASLQWSAANKTQQQSIDAVDHFAALQQLFSLLEQQQLPLKIRAVGHRVVHGGDYFQQPELINDVVEQQLHELTPLAPLHQPHHLAAITAIKQIYPDLPQVACFDTAFHHSMPLSARQYAIPRELLAQGIQHYGFHGLSYHYLSEQLPKYLGERADGRVIIAHLGNGASLCALQQRRSIATTMGFTPLDGLPMGTRSGAIDPGVLLYLLQQQQIDAQRLQELLYHQSGLLGLSGISSDMRELLSSDESSAYEAVDYFVYRCVVEIGGLVAALGGLDALVFSGGIGENADVIRARICQRLNWLGLKLDPAANEAHQTKISHDNSAVSAWVIATDEEQLIARLSRELIQTQ